MDKELKIKIEKRIALMGLKKCYIAKQIGLDKVRFSQTLNGTRTIKSDELSALLRILGL